ncbi:MAG: helix-hairpin-helix domain-containing protein [bacterium]|nr:helix-hairpin-helix domain-containing protein [bacterium]
MNSKTIVIIASIAIASSVVSSTLTAIVMQPKEATASKDKNLIASIPLGQRANSTSTLAKLPEDSRGVGNAASKPRVAGASAKATEVAIDTTLGIFKDSEEQAKKVISVQDINNEKKETSKTTATKEPGNKCSFSDGSSVSQKELIFNEINWAGSKDNSNAEWIELKNISGKELDVSGYEIIDLKEQIQIKIPAGVELPVYALYLLKRGEDTLPSLAAPIYTGALSNSAEGLKLFNDSCQLEDLALADPNWPAGDSKERLTMERKSSLAWHSSEKEGGTPGKPNSKGQPKPDPEPEADLNEVNPKSSEDDIGANQGIFQGNSTTTTTTTSTATTTPPAGSSTTSTGCDEGQININSASLEELDEIIGVGPSIGQKIIDARPFSSLDELDDKVSGIGESRLADIIAEGKACVE